MSNLGWRHDHKQSVGRRPSPISILSGRIHPSSSIVSNLLHVKTSHPSDKLDETQEVPETDQACYAPPSPSFYKQ